MLHRTGDYAVTVVDRSPEALRDIAARGVATLDLDMSDAVALKAALKGRYAVLSAAPYHLTATSPRRRASPTSTISTSPRTSPRRRW